MTTHIREPMHLSMSSVRPVYVDGWYRMKGDYLGARFVKPFETSQAGIARAEMM